MRERHCGEATPTGIRSSDLIACIAAVDAEDFDITLARPDDSALSGADAVLVRAFRQIIVRDDVDVPERAFLVAHEFGHWVLHPEEQEGCRKVIVSHLNPAEDDTLGAKRVEAYGARERAELQANLFARDLLLPHALARALFDAGRTAGQIAAELELPLELVRQQLLDAVLLPHDAISEESPEPALSPTIEQRDAARSDARTSLVVAGPGTGKTATLLMRIEHLLANGTMPAELLVLTFSNRAARELVDRLEAAGVPGAHEMWVGTFHAFGLEFLRKNHERFGLRPEFGVADKMAQIALLEPHIYGLPLRSFNPLGDPLPWLDQVVKTTQRAKDELLDAEAFGTMVEDSAARSDADRLARERDVATLYRHYESLLRAHGGLVDFGDLIMLPARALGAGMGEFLPSVGRFRHMLVDEYQDVNRASAELVKALAANADSLWVVGDPRQAIYRFRGASMRNIVRFEDDFPKHRVFRLNGNWRSFEEIVRLVEHTGRDDNPLQGVLPLDGVAPIRGQGGLRPTLVSCDDPSIAHGELVSRARAAGPRRRLSRPGDPGQQARHLRCRGGGLGGRRHSGVASGRHLSTPGGERPAGAAAIVCRSLGKCARADRAIAGIGPARRRPGPSACPSSTYPPRALILAHRSADRPVRRGRSCVAAVARNLCWIERTRLALGRRVHGAVRSHRMARGIRSGRRLASGDATTRALADHLLLARS
ncbi:UvrD-helicase domain-containing protein [Dokdonella sp.]|uniref:UvrD-helicase domain-containing protein n=1 Tax=Dokdonella sp. TaxID=2291710 RepID=UPI0025C6BB32|nr:UvrD-helicase domain-containing protein [Dokdonella sp.]